MIKWLLYSTFILFSVLFSACGEEASSPLSNTRDNDIKYINESTTESEDSLKHIEEKSVTAYFIDSAVSGIKYINENNEGITGKDGSFKYTKGNVSFYLGDLKLGTISTLPSDKNVFPQDLYSVDRKDINNSNVLKLARLLQSLDTNSDDEIITLDSSINFNLLAIKDIKNLSDNDIDTLITNNGKSIKSNESVIEHLGISLINNGIAYNFKPIAYDTNVTTIIDIAIQGTLTVEDKNSHFLKYEIIQAPTHGSITLDKNRGTYVYIPNSGFYGDDYMTFKAYDGEKSSNIATLNLSVTQPVVIQTSDTQAPTQPSIVSISSSSENNITLFWLPSNDNNTSVEDIIYEIHISEDENFTISDITKKLALKNALEANIGNLLSSTKYFVKIKAIDRAANFSISNESNITTLSQPSRLALTATIKNADELFLHNATTDSNTLTFEKDDSIVLPEIGDILIGDSHDGYLKKTTAVTETNSSVAITTTDATITEVFESMQMTSSISLFGESETDDAVIQQSMIRNVRYKANNEIETSTSWASGKFSVTSSEPISSKARSIRKNSISTSNINFLTPDGIVNVLYSSNLKVETKANLTQDAIDDKISFKSIKLKSLTHPDKKSSNNFGAYFGIDVFDEYNHVEGYISWKPKKDYVSNKPYKAVLEVTASDDECSKLNDYCNNITEEIDFEIYVVSDGKVEIGKKRNTSTSTDLTLSNDVTLDFAPKLTTVATVSGSSVESVEVSLEGKLDFDVISTLKFSAASKTEYTQKIFKPVTYHSVYMAGSVPVYQEITLDIDAEFIANANAAIEAISNLDTDFTIKAGLEYSNGEWKPLSKQELNKDYTATISVAGGADVQIRVIPNIEVKFYKVVTAGLSVEPWAKGEIVAEGNIAANTDLIDSDFMAIYRLNKLNVDVGVDANVYADLSVWEYNLAHYPSDGDKENIFAYEKSIFSLPSISLSDNGVDICSDTPYIINATTEDGTNNPFVNDFIKWKVFPEAGATLTKNSSDPKSLEFSFDKEDEYTLFFIGASEKLGQYVGKQYETFKIDTRSCILEESTPDDNTSEEYYQLLFDDIAGYLISVGDPSKNKKYYSNGTFRAEDESDGGSWSIVSGKLVHIWNNGSEEVHSFNTKPAIGTILTNETYDISGMIDDIFQITIEEQPTVIENPITQMLASGNGIWGEFKNDKQELNACYQFSTDGTFTYTEGGDKIHLKLNEENDKLAWIYNGEIVGPEISILTYDQSLFNVYMLWNDDEQDRQWKKMDSCEITYDIDTNLNVNISLSGNTLTAIFNKDMTDNYYTFGEYDPKTSYWTDSRTFKIDFNSYVPGGTITLNASNFVSKENTVMSDNISYVFPNL